MNYRVVGDGRGATFRAWLQHQLRQQDWYLRRFDRYLLAGFAAHTKACGVPVDAICVGRYLRERDPVLPTPESCRRLARALGLLPVEALIAAGYVAPPDFRDLPEELVARILAASPASAASPVPALVGADTEREGEAVPC